MHAVRILLQTTIPKTEDDWSIERFSLLRDHLASIRDQSGGRIYEVVARDRETDSEGNDVVLSILDTTDFDQLWLFAGPIAITIVSPRSGRQMLRESVRCRPLRGLTILP
jgi:hypothetical protein